MPVCLPIWFAYAQKLEIILLFLFLLACLGGKCRNKLFFHTVYSLLLAYFTKYFFCVFLEPFFCFFTSTYSSSFLPSSSSSRLLVRLMTRDVCCSTLFYFCRFLLALFALSINFISFPLCLSLLFLSPSSPLGWDPQRTRHGDHTRLRSGKTDCYARTNSAAFKLNPLSRSQAIAAWRTH